MTSDGEDADAEEREGIIKHEEEGGGASAVGSQEERPQEQVRDYVIVTSPLY